MKSNTFIYIACNFMLLSLINLDFEIISIVIYSLCAAGILTLGIAHGAIDNILYGAKPGKSNITFIIKYVIIISLFAVVWLLLPNLAFALFLVVSAYHFGQSQFAEYKISSSLLAKGLYFTWGGIVLLLMFYFSGEEIKGLQTTYLNFYPILNHVIDFSGYYLAGLIGVFTTVFSIAILVEEIPLQQIMKEVYILALITCSIFIFPVFIAFSLFFVWLHSLQVITQEFEYCRENLNILKIRDFIWLFLPLTLVSITGTAIIIWIAIAFNMEHFIPYILLIILSCITIPHSFVMDKFYGKLFG